MKKVRGQPTSNDYKLRREKLKVERMLGWPTHPVLPLVKRGRTKHHAKTKGFLWAGDMNTTVRTVKVYVGDVQKVKGYKDLTTMEVLEFPDLDKMLQVYRVA